MHKFEVMVSETDLDVFGHANNAQYLRFFEMARWDFLVQHGLGFSELMASGVGPVILEVHLQFLKEVRARDHLLIESEYGAFNGKICKIKQTMLNQSQVVCARAEFTAALFDLKMRKITEPQGVWLNLFSKQ